MAENVDVSRLIVTLEAQLVKYDRAMAKAMGTADQATDHIVRKFKGAEAELAKFGQRFGGNFFEALSPARLLAGLTAGGIAEFAKKSVENLAAIETGAKKAGLSLKDFQSLSFASLKAGGSGSEDIVEMFAKFNRNLGEAIAKGGQLADILKANKIPLKDANGIQRDNVAIFYDVLNLIKNSNSEMDRGVVAAAAFGREAAQWLPFLSQGADAIKRTQDEAKALGVVLDKDVIEKAVEFEKAWKVAWFTWTTRGESAITKMISDIDLMIKAAGGTPIRLTEDLHHFEEVPLSDQIDARVKELQEAKKKLAEHQAAPPDIGFGTATERAQELQVELARIKDLQAQIAALEAQRPTHHPEPSGAPETVIPDEAAKAKAEADAKKAAADAAAERKRQADEARKLAAGIDLITIATNREIEKLRLEATSRGKSIYEIERQQKLLDIMAKLEAEHRQHGGLITPEEVATANAQADAFGRVSQAIADNKTQFDQLKEVGDTVFGDLETSLDNFIDTGKLSFKSLVESIIKDLAKLAVHNLLSTLENGTPGQAGGGLMGLLANWMGIGTKAPVGYLPPVSRNPFDTGRGVAERIIAVEPLPEDKSIVQKSIGAIQGMPGAYKMGAGGVYSPGGPLLDMIRQHEVGTTALSGYNTTLGFGKYTGGPVNLTGGSLDRAIAISDQIRNNPSNQFNAGPVGGYQFLGSTLRDLKLRMGLTGNEMFNPQLQDRLALNLAQRSGAGGLSSTWTSLKNVAQPELMASYAKQFQTSVQTVAQTATKAAATSTAIPSAVTQIVQSLGSAGGAGGGGGILSLLTGAFGIGGAGGGSGLSGTRAEGGPVMAGGRYLVGERGPELFMPRIPGVIVPRGGGYNAGGGGFQVHVTPSKYFDVHVSRIAARGDARTLDTAQRNYPTTRARFEKLGTV